MAISDRGARDWKLLAGVKRLRPRELVNGEIESRGCSGGIDVPWWASSADVSGVEYLEWMEKSSSNPEISEGKEESLRAGEWYVGVGWVLVVEEGL